MAAVPATDSPFISQGAPRKNGAAQAALQPGERRSPLRWLR